MQPLSVLLDNSNTMSAKMAQSNFTSAELSTASDRGEQREEKRITTSKKQTTTTIDFELNEANALRLGMDCQPGGEEPGSVKCTRNEPIKWIAKLVEIIIKQEKYDVSNAAAIEYYCRITGHEVPQQVKTIMHENNLEPLGRNPPDYIASITGLFPSIIKAKRFIEYYNRMTGENLQQQLNKINSFLPGFFEEEDKETVRKKESRKADEDNTTEPKITRGRNVRSKRCSTNKKVEMLRNIRRDDRDDEANIVRAPMIPPLTTHCAPRMNYHPVNDVIEQSNRMMPLTVNIPMNGRHIAEPLNGMTYALPIRHNPGQLSQLPGFHGIPQLPYQTEGTNHTSACPPGMLQAPDPNRRGYYTTFYYDR